MSIPELVEKYNDIAYEGGCPGQMMDLQQVKKIGEELYGVGVDIDGNAFVYTVEELEEMVRDLEQG